MMSLVSLVSEVPHGPYPFVWTCNSCQRSMAARRPFTPSKLFLSDDEESLDDVLSIITTTPGHEVSPSRSPERPVTDLESKAATLALTHSEELRYRDTRDIIHTLTVPRDMFERLPLLLDLVTHRSCHECANYTAEACSRLRDVIRMGGSQSSTWIGCPTANRVHQELHFSLFDKNVHHTVRLLHTTEEEATSHYVRLFVGYQTVVERLTRSQAAPVPCLARITRAWYTRSEVHDAYAGETFVDYVFKLHVKRAVALSLARHTRISAGQYVTLALQGLAAVLGLYERGLYHNDVRPRNMIFGRLNQPQLRLELLGRRFTIDRDRYPLSLTLIDFGFITVDQPLDPYHRYDASLHASPPKIDICSLFAALQTTFIIDADSHDSVVDLPLCQHTQGFEEAQISVRRYSNNTDSDNAAFMTEIGSYLDRALAFLDDTQQRPS
jgi:hypothetical protein